MFEIENLHYNQLSDQISLVSVQTGGLFVLLSHLMLPLTQGTNIILPTVTNALKHCLVLIIFTELQKTSRNFLIRGQNKRNHTMCIRIRHQTLVVLLVHTNRVSIFNNSISLKYYFYFYFILYIISKFEFNLFLTHQLMFYF